MSFKKNISLLYWHSFFTDFSFWSPFAILYYTQVSGSYTLGLSIFSVGMLTNAFFELPTGIFSDYYGRRKTLIAGAISYTLSVLLFALGFNYTFLLLGALFEGIGRAFYSGNNEALLYDNVVADQKLEDYEEYSGKVGSGSQLALAISAALGGFAALYSLKLIIWLSVIPQLICAILGILLTETKEVSKEDDNLFSHLKVSYQNFLTNSKLRWVSLGNIIGYGIGESAFQFRSAFVATLWPIWAIGFSQVLSNIGATLSFHFSGRLIKKFSAIKILLFQGLYGRSIHLFSLLFPSVFSPALMSTTSLFFGVGNTAENSLMQREFNSKQRATMGSLISLFSKLFFALFSLLLGLVADQLGPAKALIFAQTLLISNIFIYHHVFKNHSSPVPVS